MTNLEILKEAERRLQSSINATNEEKVKLSTHFGLCFLFHEIVHSHHKGKEWNSEIGKDILKVPVLIAELDKERKKSFWASLLKYVYDSSLWYPTGKIKPRLKLVKKLIKRTTGF